MTMQTYCYKILEFDNYDGDSFDLSIDLGFDLVAHKKVRILGIDTPELRGGDVYSKALAKVAKDKAAQWVRVNMNQGGAFFWSAQYSGKYGRPLGDIFEADGNYSLTEYLIAEKLAVPYEGQAKALVAEAHKALIIHHLSIGTIEEQK